MKKILGFIFLGALSLNLNVHAMQNEQNSEITKPKAKFTKMDWAKLVAAGSGCGLFAFSALMAYPTAKLQGSKDVHAVHILSLIASLPFLLPCHLVLRPNSQAQSKLILKASLFLGGAASSIISLGLGAYVYKKLSSLKNKKEIEK